MPSLSEVYRLYEADKHLEGFSQHTLKGYGIQSRLLIRAIGDVDISDVTLFHLKSYLTEAAQRLKPSSLGHRIRFIRSFFKWVHSEGLTPSNPAHKLKEPKLGVRIPKALNEMHIELLRESCRIPFEHALVEFFFATGCRIGEIAKLNRDDISWNTRSVIVRGKGDKEREVYFTVKAEIWLKRYLDERTDDDPALFVTERPPAHRSTTHTIRRCIKRVAERTGMDINVYPHKLRHTYATHLLNNGAPLEVIQEFLGHAKLETTRLYAQLSGERRRELYRKYF